MKTATDQLEVAEIHTMTAHDNAEQAEQAEPGSSALATDELATDEMLVEEISIDGMCGVY